MDKAKRKMSSIAFPYYDLENVLEIAKAIHEHAGYGECDVANLAGWLGQTITSGTFRLRMSAARMFGLIRGDRGQVALTEIGTRAIDPTSERQGRAEAFLSVELYRAVYEKYRGKMLPSPPGLESEMVALGVAEGQKDKARQTFERSARQARFFEHGVDRLVPPAAGPAQMTRNASQVREETVLSDNLQLGGASKDRGATAEMHPLIEGLFKTLPEANKKWAIKDRVKWLQAAAFNFGLIYEGEGEIKVTGTDAPRDEGGQH